MAIDLSNADINKIDITCAKQSLEDVEGWMLEKGYDDESYGSVLIAVRYAKAILEEVEKSV